MENKGNDRKYMDGHGNDWNQGYPGISSPIPLLWLSLPAGSTAFRRVLGIWVLL
ncbi:hypothetical protein BDZ91DRAFT_751610, partial [Kalaharituber pfeilii]